MPGYGKFPKFLFSSKVNSCRVMIERMGEEENSDWSKGEFLECTVNWRLKRQNEGGGRREKGIKNTFILKLRQVDRNIFLVGA